MATIAAFTLLIAAPAASAAPLAGNKACPHSSDAGANIWQKKRAIRCQVNHVRRSRGRRALKRSKALDSGTRKKLRQIRNCARSTNVDLHDPCHVGAGRVYVGAGYFEGSGRARWGENIFWGGRGTAREAVRGWLRSPSHRRNLLRRGWRHFGVATSRRVLKGLPFFVAAFGSGGNRNG